MHQWRTHLGNPASLKRSVALLLVLLVAPTVASNAFARSLDRVEGFTHTVWTREDGVPDDLFSMAQTPDGWIWLATQRQLYRFDGVSAERYEVADTDGTSLYTIFASQSGDLWLGYVHGYTLVLPAGDFAHPRIVKGLSGLPRQFWQDAKGNMWASTPNGIYEASQFEWQRKDERSGMNAHTIYASAIDTDGTLWVLGDEGVLSLEPGHPSFEPRSDITQGLDLIDLKTADSAAQTRLSIIGYHYLLSMLTLAGKKVLPSYLSARRSIVDAESGIWCGGSAAQGVRRSSSAGEALLRDFVRNLTRGPPLDPSNWASMSQARAGGIMEDRQHNVWLSTVSGLEKFQPSVATTLSLPRGVYNYAMLPGDDGSIWFGNAISYDDFHLWRADRDAVPVAGYNGNTTATYRDSDGSILLGTGAGYIRRMVNGHFEPFLLSPPDGDDIVVIARDGQQRLWVGTYGDPMYLWSNGRWLAKGGFSQLPDKGELRAVTDPRGRLWISYPHELFILDGDHLTRYAAADGMDIAYVGDIIADGIPLVGGVDGLAAFDGTRFHRISAKDASVLTGITGMVRLKDGTLWLNGYDGGVRVDADELRRAIADPNYAISPRVYGPQDGMPGYAQSTRPLPSLIEGSDGRLWFADSEGIAWLDPSKLPRDIPTPTTIIRSITAASRLYRPESLSPLAAGTRNLQIDYTALGLDDATRARFRYQLTGIDRGWQEAGTRRQAFYTNLGPGSYQFRVMASNEDGIWGREAARVSISIQPYFHQTRWFLLICIAAGLTLLWLAYLYRLRQVTHGLHQRLGERYAERERIARELHDTFLQTVQALVLNVRVAIRPFPESSARDSIMSAINLAQEALTEGRDRVRALRASTDSRNDLGVAFEKISNEFEGRGYPWLQVTSTGAPRSVNPLVNDELYAAGREAIVNALNHSHAEGVRVVVDYEKSGLRIQVSDNGKGIDPKVLSDGGLPGHWGLRGIRERMERIGGQCRIFSNKENGTTVILYVEASHAYGHRSAPGTRASRSID